MDLTKYRVVNAQDEEYDYLLDTYREAVKVAELKSAQDGEPYAVMELTFEYSDTSLEYTTDGSKIWPPDKVEDEDDGWARFDALKAAYPRSAQDEVGQ